MPVRNRTFENMLQFMFGLLILIVIADAIYKLIKSFL
ncbi:hypothetical protein ACVW2L_000439 [Mucilaginibacter sp. HD30]